MKTSLPGRFHIPTNFAAVFFAMLLIFGGWVSIRGQEPSAKPAESLKEADDDQDSLTTQKMDKLPSQDESKIKVVFDENLPGVVIIESNGEKIRVDTAKKTVEQVAVSHGKEEANTQPENVLSKTTLEEEKEESAYDFDRGEEPYDHRVVNIPTPKSIPKGSWNLTFTHRFSQEIHPLSDSARDLFGLDSFGIASFGLSYGVTDKLYLSAYRSPLCQRGLCRVIEAGVGYNWIAMDKNSPFGLNTYASIEGNDNFTEEFTYNFQTMISARLGKRVYLFFSPAVHINSNGQRRFDPRASDFFPPAAIADTFRQSKHSASFGFGTSILLTPNVVALFDFTPRTGFKLGQVRPVFNSTFQVIGFTNESHPTMGFGIQRNVGKHAFALTFSNTQTTTTSRYNSSNLALSPRDLIIGFNLSRRF